ncbi:MAG: alpha/beta hydrolase [Hyphomicrobiales bacterium]|nr:MAG: alpha/beta hydrolase [Hyphomicrobiales bacterium]
MNEGSVNDRGIWSARGGSGDDVIVVLHGIGANASVWAPVVAEIERRGTHRWLALDFRGHGRSIASGPYGYAIHAADVAHALRDEAPANTILLGHSFGGVVAALLGSGLFGIAPRLVATLGVKLEWSAQEIAKAQEIASKPTRYFPTRPEAIERYLKGAGLFGLVDPASAEAQVGVLERPAGFEVAVDPRVYSAVGPSLPSIFSLVACPLRMAAGSKDPMVSLAAMQRVCSSARLLEGLGHNAHWESSAAVLDFVTAA